MHAQTITTRTHPDADTLARGLRHAINAAADNEYYYHSKALGRSLGGDLARAAAYEARSRAYQTSLSRLETCARELNLLRACCTSGQDCYHTL